MFELYDENEDGTDVAVPFAIDIISYFRP